ncbi:MAG: hypothetical protein CVU81_01885 [Euryarchaeota archaeon HGW-Euryarchaeota-1]|nr:MAG: hypothetical protein CVU81_01885 [Euryarchaeota archaeon HGW-Euryarchaeota-1]
MDIHTKEKIFAVALIVLGILLGLLFYDVFLSQQGTTHTYDGNISVSVINGRDYFEQVHSLLQGANSSIYLSMYMAKYYPTNPKAKSNWLYEDLIAAKKRGVDVQVVLEGGDDGFYKSIKEGNTLTFDYLKKNGIDVSFDCPKQTTHSKLFIVDNRCVVVGSTNLGTSAIDSNHEANVILCSIQEAQKFKDYFLSVKNQIC